MQRPGMTGHDRAGRTWADMGGPGRGPISEAIAGYRRRERARIPQHPSAHICTYQHRSAIASLFLGRIRFPAARLPSRARLPHPFTSRHLASVCIDMGWRREQLFVKDDMEVEGPHFGRVSRGLKSERNFQDGLCAACCQSVGRDGFKEYKTWHPRGFPIVFVFAIQQWCTVHATAQLLQFSKRCSSGGVPPKNFSRSS